ncbi:DDE-type integrase/transposase/recombinase, partial [Streptomyces sp. NPDC005463]|uniref:DDE-type integrase/transposase/recombinase n=1 Tax=Streptomyces sp. NPDC005463 TaxID=3154465 RepID=UPI0033B54F4B
MRAFYADCLHEVRPVKSGYRVTLTMNLLAERVRPAGEDDGGPVADLAHCLTEHFTEPAEERYAYGRQKAAPPNRLVYLLDHEYTQRGLGWDRLKGADATRTALLRQAAAETDCEAVLALAEVKDCTIERLMRELGIVGVLRGKKVITTLPGGQVGRAPDLVDRDFVADSPNRCWVADFTHVKTWAGVVYVAFVVDTFSRRIVGWSAATAKETVFVLDALEMAIWQRDREQH